MPRRRSRHEFINQPVGRFEWEKLILRVEIDNAAKTVALAAATYGNTDGSSVGPSVPRLAAEFGWSEKHVQNQITLLREKGLLEVTRNHSPHHPTVYQLTFPAAGIASLSMRTDVDGYPWIGPRLKARGGRPAKLTGTAVLVTPGANQNSSSGVGIADRNSSSGVDEPNQNSSSGVDADGSPLTGTPVPVTERKPELEFHQTRTPVPANRNSSSPDHIDQTKTTPMSGSYSTPTSDGAAPEPGTKDQQDVDSPDPAVAYRSARRVLDALTPRDADNALAQARAELPSITGVRPLTIRAAQIITELVDRTERPEDEP